MNKILILAIPFLLFNCKEQAKVEKTPIIPVKIASTAKGNLFTNSIEKAHKASLFLINEAVSFDLEVAFGGTTILEGKLTQLTDGSKIRVDKKDGTSILFDGKQAYMSPGTAEDPMARFHIFTWSYFFALPYKLNDAGTIWSAVTNRKWEATEEPYPSSKLSFKQGTGDAPDDWYIIYKNPTTHVLEGAAYIVSFGKDLAEAEKEPHAIKYADFTTVNEVPFATHWTFHLWTEANGYGDQIGEVKLHNITFTTNTKEKFVPPTNSKLVAAPKL